MCLHASENPYLIQEDGDWILVLERSLEHPLEVYLPKLNKSPIGDHSRPDRDLTTTGAVRLAHIDLPEADERQGYALEVNAPHLLILRWGPDIMRWELSGDGDKTVLILRHRFATYQDVASYAASWHLCLKGLTGTLAGEKLPSMVGENAFKHGWQELYEQYSKQFGKK